jgi:hypothetical protein
MLFDAVERNATRPVFSEAVVYEGDRIYEARLQLDWRCGDIAEYAKPFGFVLEYDKGALRIDSLAYPASAYLSYTSPNEIWVGVYHSGHPPLTLLEQSVTLRLNGAVDGYGCYERTVPGVLAPTPF